MTSVAARSVPGRTYFPLLIGLLAVLTAWRLHALVANGLDLLGDEAQYWDWSRTLAFGYFSKPPMIAWAIRAATSVCGDGEACIRSFSPLLHAATAAALFALARALYDQRVAFWSALGYATLPGVSFSALIASTDVPLLFFWTLALLLFVRALDREQSADWLLLGVALGFGIMSKYTMALFVPSAALFFWLAPERRPRALALRAAQVLAPALVIFAPNLVWNLDHGFATIGHTVDNARLDGPLFNPSNLGEFVGAQFGVFGPIMFAGLLWVASFGRRLLAGPSERLLACFSLPVLALMVGESFISRAHDNWAAVAYVGATVLVTAWLLQKSRALLIASLALHLAVALLLPRLDAVAATFGTVIAPRYDLFRGERGWTEAGAQVAERLTQNPGAALLVADRMDLASFLYYARPLSDSTVKWGGAEVNDHYDLTRRIGKDPSRSYILVANSGAAESVTPNFAASERLAGIHVTETGRRPLVFEVWRLRGLASRPGR